MFRCRSDCSLSLNGKDILEGDGSTKLDDLGIVSGDLVHVLTDEPVATQNTSEAKTGRQFHNEGNASKILKVDLPTSSGASGSASNTGAAKSTSSAASADEQHILPATTIVFEDAECIRDEHVNRYLHEPTVIQDSTDEAVPQSLEQVFCDNKPCDSQDACVLVLHILMLETGFKAQVYMYNVLLAFRNFASISWMIVNSSPPCAAYMRQSTASSFVRVMACCLFGAKPLPEPVMAYCQIWVKFESEFCHFHSRKFVWKCLPNGGHFVQREIS